MCEVPRDVSQIIASLRAAGGDTTDVEVKSAARQPPLFDRSTVDDATFDDLDNELVDAYLNSVRERDPFGLGRFDEDSELLRRSGVVDSNEKPTVAGILALGLYPQQWFPRYIIQAAAHPLADDSPATRARNQVTLSGPIPRMLDGALSWARRTFDTAIVAELDGSVHDRLAYPLIAFRELVANALIHRDLDHWSTGLAVEVRLLRDRLIVGNPGGLFGITVDRLGRDAVTSPRNSRLVAICQHVRSPQTGARVIEGLATGIPAVTEALANQGLPPAHYVDSGIRFTVVLHQFSPAASSTIAPTAGSSPTSTTAKAAEAGEAALSATQRRVHQALTEHGRTVRELADTLGLAAPNLRKILRDLRARGLAIQDGGQGRATTHRRAKPPGSAR